MADAARRDRASYSRTPPEIALKLKVAPDKPPERPVRASSSGLSVKPRPPSADKPSRGKNRNTGRDQSTHVAGAPIILVDSVDKTTTIDSSPDELKEDGTFMDCDFVVDSSPEHVQNVARQRTDVPVTIPSLRQRVKPLGQYIPPVSMSESQIVQHAERYDLTPNATELSATLPAMGPTHVAPSYFQPAPEPSIAGTAYQQNIHNSMTNVQIGVNPAVVAQMAAHSQHTAAVADAVVKEERADKELVRSQAFSLLGDAQRVIDGKDNEIAAEQQRRQEAEMAAASAKRSHDLLHQSAHSELNKKQAELTAFAAQHNTEVSTMQCDLDVANANLRVARDEAAAFQTGYAELHHAAEQKAQLDQQSIDALQKEKAQMQEERVAMMREIMRLRQDKVKPTAPAAAIAVSQAQKSTYPSHAGPFAIGTASVQGGGIQDGSTHVPHAGVVRNLESEFDSPAKSLRYPHEAEDMAATSKIVDRGE